MKAHKADAGRGDSRGGQGVQAGAVREQVTGNRSLAPLWPEGQRAVWKVEPETCHQSLITESVPSRGVPSPEAQLVGWILPRLCDRRKGSGCPGSRGRGMIEAALLSPGRVHSAAGGPLSAGLWRGLWPNAQGTPEKNEKKANVRGG